MMTAINIFEAKSTLSKLIADLESKTRTEVVIARHGRPVARLVALTSGLGIPRIGQAAGAFVVPDDIDVDSAQVARLFLGGLG